ncbi:MAG: tyrosine-type recombinase/integrase, partial [Burkholderiales bacterium]|nr:tyrosine-type recombinase/integrase [Burkholderiales bacterium]
ASTEQPECLEGLLGIRSIKSRKSAGRTIQYLTVEQTTQLVNAPDPKSRTGLRHRAILAVLYDGACRVQELCDLDVGDVSICGTSCTLLLKGKGLKPRTVMLSKKVAELLGKYKERFHRRSLATDPFIYGRSGRIKRNGVAYIVQKYATEVYRKDNTFPSKVHCHMLRHSKAMHMLQAGIDLVTIRDFLGHEDIATTMVYARVDNRTKEEAIGKLAPQILGDSHSEVDWRKDKDLMDFLESLK